MSKVECTEVMRLGMDKFTTVDLLPSLYSCHDMEDTSSVQSGSDDKKAKRSKKDGRFYKFVKRHFLQRRKTGNDVKEICIIPDDEEFRWARRSAGSAASRSSEETLPNSTDSQVKVVHDMAEEYVPDV